MVKILIVEDDFMIADCLEEILQDAGYEVCGIASEVEKSIQLGEEQQPDLAVIDLRLLDGRLGTEVGTALSASRKIGILYVSGNPDHPALADVPPEGCISKPYSAEAVIAALADMQLRLGIPAEVPVLSMKPKQLPC